MSVSVSVRGTSSFLQMTCRGISKAAAEAKAEAEAKAKAKAEAEAKAAVEKAAAEKAAADAKVVLLAYIGQCVCVFSMFTVCLWGMETIELETILKFSPVSLKFFPVSMQTHLLGFANQGSLSESSKELKMQVFSQ